jgi:hypothetical protein
LEILGQPEVTLLLSADRPLALAAVRLCDVAPDGSSLLVSREILNLAHRDGHDEPSALTPGTQYVVRIALTAIAHAFAAGHRLRIAISPTYWPWAWPSPEPVTLSIVSGADTRIALPIRRSGQDADVRFALAETSQALAATPIAIEPGSYESRYDATTGIAELNWSWAGGGFRLPESGLEYRQSESNCCSISDREPLSAKTESMRRISIRRHDWQVRIETSSTMTADADSFLLTTVLDAYEGDIRVFSKTWHRSIPRLLG